GHKQTLLQVERDGGTKTNIMGGGARETEEGDQAMGTIQGASGQSDKNDYSELESLEKKEANQDGESGENVYGEDNKDAVVIEKESQSPPSDDRKQYQQA